MLGGLETQSLDTYFNASVFSENLSLRTYLPSQD